jgi:hypothetical protein
MKSIPRLLSLLPVIGLLFVAVDANAQSFRVQCPTTTPFHPDGSNIKCQQIAGGDGYATMGDGNTIYMFGFGPLSGLPDIYKGLPGTEINSVFNTTFGPDTGTPSTLVGMPDGNFAFSTAFNGGPFMGAIGLTNDMDLDPWTTGTVYAVGAIVRTASAVYMASTAGTSGPTSPTGTAPVSDGPGGVGGVSWTYQGTLLDGHVEPRPIMDVGVMNASQPAPLIAIDEDDELFLTLTNVGMIMRPDLFEQHTVHFHGYPNASAFYDGVPDASIAINVGGSFTYYYLAPDAGTYFWHCHIAPPEHLQMGMVGQIYVRPRQNKVTGLVYAALAKWETGTPAAYTNQTSVTSADWASFEPLRKRCGGKVTTAAGALVPADILCTTPLPAPSPTVNLNKNAVNDGTKKYAYNDGDGSTYYDVEYPIQIHGFDPNFHFVGMTFNPESFNDMKDKYFMLNGRSYPDTVGGHNCVPNDPLPACKAATQANNVGGVNVVAGPMETQSVDGTPHASQPIPTVINIPAGGHALLRISDLDVSEYQTLASLGIPMRVVGLNARLLRDMAGNNMAYSTNSITLAGGESIDVILDATGLTQGQKFYLYTPNLDHLSNDAENFGGLMTEVNICTSVDPQTKACTI